MSKETNSKKVTNIVTIKGMAEKTAESFVERIPNFIQFMQEAGLVDKLSQNTSQEHVNTSHPLFGKTVVLTGFRDVLLQNELKKVGVKIGASVSKNTFAVLVKDILEDTGKAGDAKKLGIPLITHEDFKNKYL